MTTSSRPNWPLRTIFLLLLAGVFLFFWGSWGLHRCNRACEDLGLVKTGKCFHHEVECSPAPVPTRVPIE